MESFGPGYTYVVMGYPPFLKNLADDPRADLSAYDVIAYFGGEGLSENMRRYLLKSFREVIGSYGASDLEINMAAESEFTIALRQELERNDALRAELTNVEYGVLPMVFQYNPFTYVIETNDLGELLVTICRRGNISPRIKYNIHDRGHVIRMPELARGPAQARRRPPARRSAARPSGAVPPRPVGSVRGLLRRDRHAGLGAGIPFR